MTEPNEQQPQRLPRDRPWLMRTYAGHSSATESNALYRRNLAKGQTGLSVAFDLPTQTGYDADHILARGPSCCPRVAFSARRPVSVPSPARHPLSWARGPWTCRAWRFPASWRVLLRRG